MSKLSNSKHSRNFPFCLTPATLPHHQFPQPHRHPEQHLVDTFTPCNPVLNFIPAQNHRHAVMDLPHGFVRRDGEDSRCLGYVRGRESSLLNALTEQEAMAVKTIHEEDIRGHHTTTHRQLFILPSGALVIDTPDMSEISSLMRTMVSCRVHQL